MDEKEAARSEIEQGASAQAANERAERAAGRVAGKVEQIALARLTGAAPQIGDAPARGIVAGLLGGVGLLGQPA
jgi:hypothetical protein